MLNNPEPSDANPPSDQEELPTALPAGWLRQHPWVTFLLPMIVYMLMGSLEPTPPYQPEQVMKEGALAGVNQDEMLETPLLENSNEEEDFEDDYEDTWLSIQYHHYPYIYTLKIALTLLAMILVLPGYRTFRWQLSPWSVVVGVVGVVLWVGLCHLDLESRLLESLGLSWLFEQGQRSAFNPLAELSTNVWWAYGFLAIRFLGLAVVVPIIEEFFLRGFMMRYVISVQWWEWPFGKVIPIAVLVGTGIPMLMHPGELLAAFVWFSMVTCLMVATRNIWDCVVAHATTNLLLGIYVVSSGQWQLM